jgi:hypothetical protein
VRAAALGLQMHSGWGVLVAVSLDPLTMLARRRIVVAAANSRSEIQPYHFAAELPASQQQEHINRCALTACALARTAIAEVIEELSPRLVAGAAVILASGRQLPALPKILSAHPLIHTAEGEFFRQAAIDALEGLKIPVTAIRDRDIDQFIVDGFGKSATQLEGDVSRLGTLVGPPWTRDHKRAALAAAVVLQTVK